MNVGRRLSVWAGLAAGATGAAAAIALAQVGVPPASPLGVAGIGGAAALLTFAVVFPFGAVLDRHAGRLRALLESVRHGEKPDAVMTGGSLAPLAAAVEDALAAMNERVEQAKTELRELEIRRRVSESERQHTEAVLHSLRDAVLVTDPFNELTMANERAAEMFGFDVHAALHRPIDEIVKDDALRKMIREAREMAAAGQRRNVEYSRKAPDGQPTELESGLCYDVSLTCLPDPQHEVGGVVTILRDITREREINQMKSEFVSKVSHELRTPLSSINAYVELLIDGDAADEASKTEFYGIIKNESDRLGRLIDNMLNISRIEAGIVKVNRTEVDFQKAAERAIEVIRPQAKQKNIGVTLSACPMTCTAMADGDMMHQVILNLLSNAVKYTPEGGRVTVSLDNDDTTRSVMVTVADTGLGIPPDAMKKIWEKFYRIENYKRVAKGTGLGLSLVKHIVETVHKGQVSVTSELGMGSRFTFTIPYEAESA